MPRKTRTTSKTRAARPKAKTAPALDPAGALRAYLEAEASTDQVGTVALPKPYVTKGGRVYVHSRSMTRWAKRELGKQVEQRDVQAALRSLGLAVRTTTLPGQVKTVGMYQGKPKGVSFKGLPVRDRRRSATVRNRTVAREGQDRRKRRDRVGGTGA
jgi:hypothetical protein